MNIVKLNLYKTELFVYRRYNVDVSLTLNEETARKILTMCTIHALVQSCITTEVCSVHLLLKAERDRRYIIIMNSFM